MADATGLTDGFRTVFGSWPRRRLDPGDGYAQVVLGLADGATCLSDVTAVAGNGLFDEAASNTTRWDWFNRISSAELAGIRHARAAARAEAWARGGGPKGSTMIIDIDATIITGSDGKQDSAGTWKGTWGHHPLVAVVADTGEVLGGIVRPGNAGSNTAADHIELLDQVIGSLPEAWQVGHRVDHHVTGGHEQLVVKVGEDRLTDQYLPVAEVHMAELARHPVGEVEGVVLGIKLDVGARVGRDDLDDVTGS